MTLQQQKPPLDSRASQDSEQGCAPIVQEYLSCRDWLQPRHSHTGLGVGRSIGSLALSGVPTPAPPPQQPQTPRLHHLRIFLDLLYVAITTGDRVHLPVLSITTQCEAGSPTPLGLPGSFWRPGPILELLPSAPRLLRTSSTCRSSKYKPEAQPQS